MLSFDGRQKTRDSLIALAGGVGRALGRVNAKGRAVSSLVIILFALGAV